MPGDECEPLLGLDEEEEEAPWDAVASGSDEEAAAGGGGAAAAAALERGHARALFARHPDDALRALQRRGVVKLGEFRERADVALPAFGGEAMLTRGSARRAGEWEAEWRRELERRAGAAARRRGRGRAARRGGAAAPPSGDVVVEAYVVAVRGAARPDAEGLIQPVLRRWHAGGAPLEAWGLPAVQAIVDFKWRAFAARVLAAELACYLLWVASFLSFCWLFQDEDLAATLPALLATRAGALTVAAELAALAFMSPFLLLEAGTLRAYGLRGWASIWNGVDLATYAIQLSAAAMHLSRRGVGSDALSGILAAQCVLLLFRMQYFSSVFKSTRVSFLDALRDVLAEVGAFLLFLAFVVLAYAAAFYVLFRREQAVKGGSGAAGFDTFPRAALTVWAAAAEGLDYAELLATRSPGVAAALNLSYQLCMSLILMNLLIAFLTASLEKVTEHGALKLTLAKATVIDELEATLPKWLERRLGRRADGSEGWHPRYVHVLRIDRGKLDKLDLSALWSSEKGSGKGAAAAGGGGGEGAGEEVRAELAALGARLDAALAALGRVEAALAPRG